MYWWQSHTKLLQEKKRIYKEVWVGVVFFFKLRRVFLSLKKDLFYFGRAGSLLLHAVFLWLQGAGAIVRHGAWASHCSGFSSRGSQASGA